MTHLFVTNDFPPKLGGIQSYLWELWRRLPEGRGTVMTTTYDDSDAFDATLSFPVVRTDSVLLPTPMVRSRIIEEANKIDADLIVLDPAHVVGLLGPSLGRPYAVIVHGAELAIPARMPGYNLGIRHVLRNARLIIAAGAYVAREAQAIAPDVDVVDIPPGVDGQVFTPSGPDERLATRRALGVAEDAEVVFHLSRLVTRKGADTLIRAVNLLKGKRPKLVALIGGKFGAAALVIGFGRFLALLDHLGEQGEDFVIAQKLAAVLGAVGDVTVFQRRKDQPQRSHALLVGGLHGRFHFFVELFAQAHDSPLLPGGREFRRGGLTFQTVHKHRKSAAESRLDPTRSHSYFPPNSRPP